MAAGALTPITRWTVMNDGAVVPGAKLYTFTSGTNTPASVYNNADLDPGHAHANPVVADVDGTFPVIYLAAIAYRFLITDANGVTVFPAQDSVYDFGQLQLGGSGGSALIGFIQAGTGAVARTVQAKLRQVYDVKDFGATGDGSTDDTAAIQQAIDNLQSGDSLFFPETPNGTFYRITADLTLPVLNGITFYGEGVRASRIKQVTSGQDLFNSNTVWASPTNGFTLRGLWLQGVTGSRYGFRCVATSRATIENCRFEGFTAGLYLEDSLILRITGNEFDGNTDGILEDGTAANSGPNGCLISGNIIENNTQYGLNLSQLSGSSINGNAIEANAKGGMRITTSGGGNSISGNYFEENRDGSGSAVFDVSLGASSFVTGTTIDGNYFNGRSGVDDYYPIRLGSVNGCTISQNSLAVGNRFLRFENANSTDVVIEPQGYHAAVTLTDPSTIYGNIPASWLANRNRLADIRVVPILGQNVLKGDFPYGGWTTSLGAGSTWARSASVDQGRPIGTLVRTTANSEISQSVVISATSNAAMRSRYVTFGIDCLVTAGTGTITVTNTLAAVAYSRANADGWTTLYASVLLAAGATTCDLSVSITSNNMTVFLGNPRLYVGLDAMSGDWGLSTTPYWVASAAPAAGPWLQGDFVWNSAPSGATPDLGWTCTASGSPGTWVALVCN